jgi:CDP-paratose 2-epimerase
MPVVSGKRYSIPGYAGTTESQPLDFHSPYGCSKGAADQYVRDFGRIYGLPTVVLRMSCVAGPRQFGTEDQGWVAHFVYSALQNRPVVIYGDGRQVRDVLCVNDLVRAFHALRQNIATTRAEVYNVGGGAENSTSLLELMDEIERLTGKRMACVPDERRVGDQLVYVTDNAKIRRDTGWKPETSLKKTIQLLQRFWEENHGMLAQHELAPAASSFALATELSGRAG